LSWKTIRGRLQGPAQHHLGCCEAAATAAAEAAATAAAEDAAAAEAAAAVWQQRAREVGPGRHRACHRIAM